MNEFYNKLRYFEEIEKVPKKVYYHYTSLDALYSIVQSHIFRLTSLKSSNDRTELFYKPTNFIADINRLCIEENDENAKKCFNLMRESFETHKDIMLKELNAKKHPYALCFAEKRDNLTHWDRYALNCTGVAIGFNVNALDILYKRLEPSGFALGLLDLGHTLYTQAGIDSVIKRELQHALSVMIEMDKKDGGNDLKSFIDQCGYLFLGAACTNIMKFAKTEAFFDEDEFRIYFDPNNISSTKRLINNVKGQISDELLQNIEKNFSQLVDSLNLTKEEFTMSRAGIRGYYNLCLDEIWGSGLIPEIILGPMCVQNISELRRFLKANGLEGTKVSTSKVPIR